jgi:hypothetical protein
MALNEHEIELIADAVLRRIEDKQRIEEIADAIVRMLSDEQKRRILNPLPAPPKEDPEAACPEAK